MAQRARRWIAGSAGVGIIVSTAVVFGPLTSPASAVVSSIPSNYFTVLDSGGVNDENGGSQLELTQMGRDDTDASFYQLFWSWDAIDFTGQTGDACALFDSDGDGNVNFNICIEIKNGASAGTIVQTASSLTAHTCTDSDNDRCKNPVDVAPGAGQLVAGPIDNISNSGGDLVTSTDPFTGQVGAEADPKDSTIAVKVAKSLLPSGAQLVNVCNYESLANGGNNNPNDCIVNPGGGFLSIVKHTTGGDGTFDFTVNPGSIAKSVTTSGGTGTSTPKSLLIGSAYSVAETVPSDWLLTGATCAKQGGTVTGTFDAANDKVTDIAIESGKVTTCTFSDTAAAPELTLDKKANVSTYSAVGDHISYTYDVTNTGNVPLTPPYAVSDDKVTVTCPQTPDPLAINDSIQCTAGHNVTQADLNAGSITNTATATAKYNGDTVESNEDNVTVTAVQSPELTLDKASPDLDYDHAGQVLSYTYDLENTGNVTLSAPYTITDDLTTADCPAVPATLAPGETVQCTATYTVEQSDLDAGSITNHARGHAHYGNGVVDSNQDSVTINAKQDASLHLAKDVTESSYDHVGQVLHYTYTLTNNGNVTLTSPYDINDDLIGDAHIDCTAGPATLAPAAHFDCTGTYTVTQLDIDAGSITNHATATAKFGGDDVQSNQAEATIDAAQSPELTLDKTALDANYHAVGDVLDYSFRLTNSGNVTLSAPFAVDDDLIASVDCPIAVVTLAPGEHFDCTGSYTVTQADLDAGHVDNHATASATFGGDPVESNPDEATVPAVQSPALGLDKVALDASYSAVGDVLDYTYTLTNTGNVTLSAPYSVDDNLIASVDCSLGPLTLAPTDSFECSGSYTVTQADLDAGSVVNIATATATFDGDPVVSDPDTATVPAIQNPSLTLVKNVAQASYDAVGDVLDYTYTLSNTGNVTLSAPYAVADDKIPSVDCSAVAATLAPGDSGDCTASYSVSQADVDAGEVVNHATATASFGNTVVQSNQDEARVPAILNPAFDLVKSVDKKTANYGSTLTYTLAVTNVGNQSLTGVVVGDEVPDGTTYVDGSAKPGAIASFDSGHNTVNWAVGNLAVGETVDNLTFQVTIDTPNFDTADGLPPTKIDNVGFVRGDQVAEQPSNHVKTTVLTVLGVKVVKPPKQLPFTGASVPPQVAAALALLLIVAGFQLSLTRRRRRS